jgi:hypothetical protein
MWAEEILEWAGGKDADAAFIVGPAEHFQEDRPGGLGFLADKRAHGVKGPEVVRVREPRFQELLVFGGERSGRGLGLGVIGEVRRPGRAARTRGQRSAAIP